MNENALFTKAAWILVALIVTTDVEAQGDESISFSVLGHLRGDAGRPNYLMDELFEEVRVFNPDFVVLTGDMIYGDTHADITDAASVQAEWDALDARFAGLDVPSYRVVGGHDIHDVTTKDIYVRRYGDPVQAVSVGRLRLLLLNSTNVPGDGRTEPFGKQRDLDPDQIDFIKRQLSDADSYDHVFVFLHHLLWWEPDAAWWQSVHPLLAGGKVRAVFCGEYGPMKFSHMNRDGIDYFQGSIESAPAEDAVVHARHRWKSRLLSQQFDNFFHVTVSGADWSVKIETLGEVSSRKFTPQFWHTADQPTASRKWKLLWEVLRRPKGLAAIAAVVAIIFSLGYATSAWRGRAALKRRE